jgi:hypothetical protein
MFEFIWGILAGLMVKDWSDFIAYPCIIGLCQTIMLAFRPKSFTTAQIARMKDDGMNEDDIREAQEGLDLWNHLTPGWIIYPQQFVSSAIKTFPMCLIVGGIKLWLFE